MKTSTETPAIAGSQGLARRLRWVLVALCLADFAALAPHLLVPDLNLDYPFVDGDSYDWLANGLRFAGHDVRYSGRPPLLPLALSLLDRLGALRLWPLAALALFLATVLGFFTLAARRLPAAAAFATALLLLGGYSLAGIGLDLMADVPASCLVLWSASAFLTAAERPRRYAWSGLLAGLAGLTQPLGLLVVPVAGTVLLVRRRRELATRWPWIGLALAAACPCAWALVEHLAFADLGDSLLGHSRFVGFHLSSAGFYLWNLVSMLGLPACLLLAAGIAAAGRTAWRGRDPERADGALFALLLFAGSLGFFTFVYLWNGKRFEVYAAWPAGLLLAEALAPLAGTRGPLGRACFAAVAALAVGGAALPLPEPARDGAWAALWPLPPLAAHRAGGGGPVPAAGAAGGDTTPITVERLRAADLARWSVFGRAAAAAATAAAERRRGVAARPDPGRFAAAASALYLFDRPDDGGGRYRTITRLSNALYKPVRFVPRSVLAPYWRWLALSPPVRLTADYAVYPAALPGAPGSWLLVTPGDRPLAPRLLPAAGQPAAAATGNAAKRASAAAAEAAAIAAWVGHGYAYVALFPPTAGDDPVALDLLFLLPTAELYVVEPRDAAGVRALLARAPVARRWRCGGAQLLATSINRMSMAVIDFVPGTR